MFQRPKRKPLKEYFVDEEVGVLESMQSGLVVIRVADMHYSYIDLYVDNPFYYIY